MTLRLLPDEAVIGALGAAASEQEPVLRNVIATEALNRARRTRAVLEHIGEGVCTFNREGTLTYANPTAEQLLGLPATDMMGRPVDSLLNACTRVGEPISACEEIWKDVIETRQAREREDVQFTRRTGERFPVSCSIAPLLDDGEVEGVVLTFRDITSRRSAEHLLREGEERIRALTYTLTDVMTDAVACVADDGTLTYVSPSIQRIFGRTPDEVVGRPWHALITLRHEQRANPSGDVAGTPSGSGDRGKIPAARRPADGLLDVCGGTHQAIGKDGATVWVEVRLSTAIAAVLAATAGSDTAHVVTIRDVTERERARATLLRSEQRYRRLVETMAEMVIVCQLDGCMSYVSPAARALLGYDPEELEGRMAYDQLAPVDAKRLRYELSKLRNGRPQTVTTRIICRDGSLKWFEANIRLAPPSDGHDRPTILIVARDVTDAIDTEVQAFASTLTSDLLTDWPDPDAVLERIAPVHGARGVGATSDDGEGSSSSQDSFQLLKIEARRLAQQLHLLAQCARARRQPLELVRADVGDVARGAADWFALRGTGEGVELDVQPMPSVEVDIKLARILFLMLFRQACAESAPDKPVRISLGPGSVRDEFVLEYDAAPDAMAEGLAGATAPPSMALAIAATIVSRHGGELHVESKGSRRRASVTFRREANRGERRGRVEASRSTLDSL